MRGWIAVIISLIATAALAGFSDFQCGSFNIIGGGQCLEQCPSLSPVSYTFANESTTHTTRYLFTLSNSGRGYANISSLAMSDRGFRAYSTADSSCLTNLSPGSSCTVLTKFSPYTSGSQSGRLAVVSRNYATQYVNFYGTGLKAGSGGGGSSCTGLLVCQNFEGTGYDNSETWTETAGSGSIDEDSTTTPLRGSQSLVVTSGATLLTETVKTHTTSGEVWGHAIVKFGAAPSTNMPLISQVGSGFGIDFKTTGATQMTCDTAYTGATAVANTTKHIWWHYKKGTGANAVCEYWIGTATTRPATQERTVSNGILTLDTTGLSLRARYSSAATFDQVVVDDADFSEVTQ